jgi:hypothetical protein
MSSGPEGPQSLSCRGQIQDDLSTHDVSQGIAP